MGKPGHVRSAISNERGIETVKYAVVRRVKTFFLASIILSIVNIIWAGLSTNNVRDAGHPTFCVNSDEDCASLPKNGDFRNRSVHAATSQKNISAHGREHIMRDSTKGVKNSKIMTNSNVEESERVPEYEARHSQSTSVAQEQFRNCTSPEKDIPWPFDNHYQLSASSILNPHLKCGLGTSGKRDKTGFIDYFRETIRDKIIRPILEEEKCEDLVVFGAAFGETYISLLSDQLIPDEEYDHIPIVNSTNLIEQHGRCFFMFVNPADTIPKEIPRTLGHYWLIPIPIENFPYENPRRNAKLLKYMGHLAFLNDRLGESDSEAPSHIIWQDAKFFRYGFDFSIPKNYTKLLSPRGMGDTRKNIDNASLPCLTTMGLPVSVSSFNPPITSEISLGIAVSSYRRPRFRDHCRTIMKAIKNRPDVTDSTRALVTQCREYVQYADNKSTKGKEGMGERGNQTETEVDPLDFGLIDSAFLIWKESTLRCRAFNAALRCSMLDQLQCHSDRDQVLFPMVIRKLVESNPGVAEKEFETGDDGIAHSLRATYSSGRGDKMKLDNSWRPHAHDLELVTEDQDSMLRITQSSCHWYYFNWARNQPMGERLCGYKIWITESLEAINPFHEQERIMKSLISNYPNPSLEISKEPSDEIALESDSRGVVGSSRKNDDIDSPFVADFHSCTSPEFDSVRWTFQSDFDPRNRSESLPTRDKGEDRLTPLYDHLKRAVPDSQIRDLASGERCPNVVIFGETLSLDTQSISSLLSKKNSDKESDDSTTDPGSEEYFSCRFLFTLTEHFETVQSLSKSDTERMLRKSGLMIDTTNSTHQISPQSPVFTGQYWLIPVSGELLPYKSMVRNARMMKYSGGFWFSSSKKVIFQEFSFFYSVRLPEYYLHLSTSPAKRTTITKPDPCVTVVALPRENREREQKGNYEEYCNSVVEMLKIGDDDVAIASIIQQCNAYIQFVYKRELTTTALDSSLADTDFLIWNQESSSCRSFNSYMTATIRDQLHCHSDNDKLVFPMAVYIQHQIALAISVSSKTQYGNAIRRPIGLSFDRAKYTLNYVQDMTPWVGKPGKQDTVRVLPEKTHWTRKRTRKNENGKRVQKRLTLLSNGT